MSRGRRNRQTKRDPWGYFGPSTPSTQQNALTEFIWKNYLMDLCLTKHEWTGLPPGVDPLYLNRTLYYRGTITFFRDDENTGNRLVAHPGVGNGQLNPYGDPVEMTLRSVNGLSWQRHNTEFRTIYERSSRLSSAYYVDFYARRLASVTRTIDTNLLQQKTINLIVTTEEGRLSVENAIAARGANEEVATVASQDLIQQMQLFTATAPFVADKLANTHDWVLDQAYTFLGINNANQNKKERLVESEISANDEQIEAARLATLQCLRTGLEQVNKLFGTEIQVFNSTDYESRNHELANDQQLQLEKMDGGVEDASVPQ